MNGIKEIEQLIAKHGGEIEIDWSDRFDAGVLIWSKGREFLKERITRLQFAELQKIIDPRDVPIPNQVLVFSEPTQIKLI